MVNWHLEPFENFMNSVSELSTQELKGASMFYWFLSLLVKNGSGSWCPSITGCLEGAPEIHDEDHKSPGRKWEAYGPAQAEELSGCPSLSPKIR